MIPAGLLSFFDDPSIAEASRRAHLRDVGSAAASFRADRAVDVHDRMEEALGLPGKLPRAIVRPPLTKLSADEIARIRRAPIAAGSM